MGYDFDRPYVDAMSLPEYMAIDKDEARRYGHTVRGTDMTNSEYAIRYNRLAESNNMKPPPSHNRKFPGYLVVRMLGTKDQYETWMPDHVFDDIYVPAKKSTRKSRRFHFESSWPAVGIPHQELREVHPGVGCPTDLLLVAIRQETRGLCEGRRTTDRSASGRRSTVSTARRSGNPKRRRAVAEQAARTGRMGAGRRVHLQELLELPPRHGAWTWRRVGGGRAAQTRQGIRRALSNLDGVATGDTCTRR